MNNRVSLIKENFSKNFGGLDNTIIVRAPGRVNLIGEHTDYNEGFVLPIAIDRDILIIARKIEDNEVKMYSVDFNELKTTNLDRIFSDFDKPREKHWSNYPSGVLYVLKNAGYNINGIEFVITGNIPVGASLSSSAAFEVATLFAVKTLYNLNISDIDIIKLSQKAENEYVGVMCGIMDQFISCLGKKDNALFLDCRDLSYEYVPLNMAGYKIVVLDTKKKRELIDSAYNSRRKECEDAAEIFGKHISGVKSLRDVKKDEFVKYKNLLTGNASKRAEHIVFENDRVIKAKDLLRNSKFESFGRELNNSHVSLRDLYEVSCDELNLMVDLALSREGVLGARMTGAGFGGCAMAVVKDGYVKDVCDYVKKEYKSKTNIDSEIYVCNSADGVGIVGGH